MYIKSIQVDNNMQKKHGMLREFITGHGLMSGDGSF